MLPANRSVCIIPLRHVVTQFIHQSDQLHIIRIIRGGKSQYYEHPPYWHHQHPIIPILVDYVIILAINRVSLILVPINVDEIDYALRQYSIHHNNCLYGVMPYLRCDRHAMINFEMDHDHDIEESDSSTTKYKSRICHRIHDMSPSNRDDWIDIFHWFDCRYPIIQNINLHNHSSSHYISLFGFDPLLSFIGVIPNQLGAMLRRLGCEDSNSVIHECRSLIIKSGIDLLLRRHSYIQSLLSWLKAI